MDKFKKNIFTEDINIKSNTSLNSNSKNKHENSYSNNNQENTQLTKKIKQLQNYATERKLNIQEIQRLTWSGIPFEYPKLRSEIWKILLEYIPTNTDNAKLSINRKRQEYSDTCLIYDSLLQNPTNNMTESELKMYKQILVDVPRTMTEYKLFTYDKIRKMLLRILYVWSKRHPASGYVQGFNDLLTPFVSVFITNYIEIDVNTMNISEEDLNKISSSEFEELEADSYWCFKKMMDKIQTNYINGQPGLQAMLEKIQEIIKLVDKSLLEKINKFDLKFIEFAFRWINCYLMREFNLKLIIRLWDTYFSMDDAFNTFHLFVCACLLLNFSDQIKKMNEYQEIIMFLQKMPLDNWNLDDIEILLAKSYQIYNLYGNILSTNKNNNKNINTIKNTNVKQSSIINSVKSTNNN